MDGGAAGAGYQGDNAIDCIMRSPMLWTMLFLAACARGDGDMIEPAGPLPPPPPPPAPVFRLSLNPSSSNPNKTIGLLLGGTLQLIPRLVSATGDTIQPAPSVGYLSRAAGMVSVSAGGLLTALAIGSTSIEAATLYGGTLMADTLVVVVTCTTELTLRVTPQSPVLAPGDRFTPSIVVTSCGGQVTVTDTFTWSVVNPATLDPIVSTVVSVNPVTGETIALAPGTALVLVRGQQYPILGGINVTVR